MDQQRSIGCERLASDDRSNHESAHGFVSDASLGRWSDRAARSAGAGRSQCVPRGTDGGPAPRAGNLEKVIAGAGDQEALLARKGAPIGGANRNCGRIIIWKSPKKRRVS